MPKRIAYKILIGVGSIIYLMVILAIVCDIPPDEVGQPE